jgi:hypothetical protein
MFNPNYEDNHEMVGIIKATAARIESTTDTGATAAAYTYACTFHC